MWWPLSNELMKRSRPKQAKTSNEVFWDQGEFKIGIKWSTVWMCRICVLCLSRKLLFFVLALPCQSAYDATLGSWQCKRDRQNSFPGLLSNWETMTFIAFSLYFLVFSHFMDSLKYLKFLSRIERIASARLYGTTAGMLRRRAFGTQLSKMFQSDDQGRRKEWENLVWPDGCR